MKNINSILLLLFFCWVFYFSAQYASDGHIWAYIVIGSLMTCLAIGAAFVSVHASIRLSRIKLDEQESLLRTDIEKVLNDIKDLSDDLNNRIVEIKSDITDIRFNLSLSQVKK